MPTREAEAERKQGHSSSRKRASGIKEPQQSEQHGKRQTGKKGGEREPGKQTEEETQKKRKKEETRTDNTAIFKTDAE